MQCLKYLPHLRDNKEFSIWSFEYKMLKESFKYLCGYIYLFKIYLFIINI